MTREEFYERLLSNVQERLSDCFHKEQYVLEKMKFGERKEFMALEFTNEPCGYTRMINLDEYYERYLTGEEMEEAAREIEKTGRSIRKFLEETGHLSLKRYEDVRSRIVLFPVPRQAAPKEKNDYIRYDHGPFSVCFYAVFAYDEIKKGMEALKESGEIEDSRARAAYQLYSMITKQADLIEDIGLKKIIYHSGSYAVWAFLSSAPMPVIPEKDGNSDKPSGNDTQKTWKRY